MRKADYETLARTIRAYAIGEHRAHLADLARTLAQSLSVDRAAFLRACGIEPAARGTGANPHQGASMRR